MHFAPRWNGYQVQIYLVKIFFTLIEEVSQIKRLKSPLNHCRSRLIYFSNEDHKPEDTSVGFSGVFTRLLGAFC